MPLAPKTSKKALFGLNAAATALVASIRRRQKSRAEDAEDWGRSSACGSRPIQSNESMSRQRCSRISKNEIGTTLFQEPWPITPCAYTSHIPFGESRQLAGLHPLIVLFRPHAAMDA